jgi:HEAT repeat protein
VSSKEPTERARTVDEGARTRENFEGKSTEELFAATLKGGYEDDAPWEAVSVLRLRGGAGVFEVAKRYCGSGDPKARARGLSVLAQLDAGKPDVERPFMAECVSIAIEHIRESDEEVVCCAAWALSHLGTERAVATLINLRNHPDADVRHAIACCIELRKHPEGVNVLTALMEDEDEVIRDWATFPLGNDDVIEGGMRRFTDSPEIRTAFRRRLDDSYEEARREAIWGLALRNDPLGVSLLLKHLESEEWWNGDRDTAEELLGLQPDTSVEELRDGLRRLLA